MATQEVNKFSSFKLTLDEFRNGSMLSVNQKLLLQNIISEKAHLKLALSLTTTQDFIQQEAYITGQLELLQYLFDLSDAAEVEALYIAANQEQ